MTTINWTGGSGSWGDAADWAGGAVPNTSDDVQIEVPNITVTVGSGVAASAYSLTTVGSTLAITGGSLDTVSYANFGGAYQQSAGVYMASGQGASFNNSIAMTGGTMEALAGATFSINNGGSLAGTFAGTGTLEFSGGTTYINSGFSSSISNFVVNALVGFNTNFSTSSYFAEGGSGDVDLFGHKLTLSGNVLIDGILGNGQVVDSGTLTIGSPQFTSTLDNGLVVSVNKELLQAGNTNFGTGDAGAKISVGKKGEYLINGNWNVFDPSSIGSISNAGVFAKTAGGKTATVYTSFSSTGTIKTETGMLSLNGLVNAVNGTVTGSGTLGIGGTGITTFGSKLTLSQAGFDQQSGIVVLNKALSFGGEWDMNGGTLNLNSAASTLTLATGGHANFDGGLISGYGGTILLNGATQMGNVTIGGPNTLIINGTLDQTNNIAFGTSSNPLADIATGATWSLQGDSDITGQYGLIDNLGTFIDPNGSGTAIVSPEFESSGTVTVNNGALRFSGPTVLGGVVNGSGLLDLSGSTVLETGVSITVAQLDVNDNPYSVGLAANLSFGHIFSQTSGALDLGGYTLDLAGSASFDGGSVTDGGTLTLAGPATIANYTVANGSVMNITGAAEQTTDLTIAAADLTVAGTGTYTIDDNNNINASGGAALVIAGDFIANGTGSSIINPAVIETGTLQVNNGTLQLASGGTLAGLVAGTGTLSLSGSPFTLENGFDATVSAMVLQASASFSITANESFGGYFVDDGYLNLSNNATFSTTGTALLSGNVNISGMGTVVASNDTTLSGVNVLNGATLDLTSTVEQGPTNLSVGTSATVIVGVSSVYTLDGGQSILGSGVLDVAGTLNAAEDGNSLINPAIVDAGMITSNLGTLDILNAVSGSGGFVIGAAGTLEFALGSTITASNTISFGAAGGTLFLQDESQDKPTFGAELAGFATGDTIELYDFASGTTTGSLVSGHNNEYVVTDSSDNNSITLTFTTSQNASALYIGSSSDGRALVLHH
jgi:fibronectin-binding autotransporter adhesin